MSLSASGPLQATSETYRTTLHQLSQPPVQPELYSRVQYQPLARYLSRTLAEGQEAQNGGSSQTQRHGNPNQKNFIHVVVHTFSNGIYQTPASFDLHDGLQRLTDLPQPDTNSCQLVYVRGSLSPAWIEALGKKYKIDPEFFRRHLRYLPGPDYSDMPSLPSATIDTSTFIVPSLYSRTQALTPDQIRRYRDKDTDVARKNQQSISSSAASGETVVRRFTTLSDRLFSLEHEVSIFTRSKKNHSQIAVILLDNGLDMNREGGPPCMSRQDSTILRAPITGLKQIPIVVPRPSNVNFNVDHPAVPKGEESMYHSFRHVASLLPFYHGMSLDTSSSQLDFFTLICEIFRLVAGAECQFLNQLYGLIKDQPHSPTGEEDMGMAIDNLRYINAISEDHKQRLGQNIAFLKSRYPLDSNPLGQSVPFSSTETKQTQRSNELMTILTDFEDLLARTARLCDFCAETVSLIVNRAMLRESQKAIQRADDQRRLTVLAYLFLPLSLVCSFFGMNVKELGTGTHSVWLPFVVLAPVAAISWLLFYTHKVGQAFAFGKRLMQRRHPRHHTHGATIPLSTFKDNEALSPGPTTSL